MLDDDWDEPVMLVHPSDASKASEFAMRIEEVKDELAEVHSHAALHLSLALSALQSATSKPHAPLEPLERDELLEGFATAHALARIGLADLDHEIAHRGIEAATGQIMFLAASDEGRRSWSDGDLARLAAAARILRDDLHNRSLITELRRDRRVLRSRRTDGRGFRAAHASEARPDCGEPNQHGEA